MKVGKVLLSLTITLPILLGNVVSRISDKVLIDSIQDIEKRLLDLDDGLDKLISDVSKLKSQLTGVTDHPVSSSIVDVVMVQRTRVANGFNFSVTYRPHIDDVSVWWTDDQNILKPDSAHTVDIGQSTKLTSVLYPVQNIERIKIIVVNFFSPKLLSYVDVHLQASINGNENITQSIDSTPSLAVGTTGDIVYEKGKNVSIKIQYAPQSNKTNPNIWAEVVNLRTWKFSTEYPASNAPTFIDITKSQSADGKEVINVNFMTSSNYVSGLVHLDVEHFVSDSLVEKINFSQFKVLRPDTETGPFPSSFLHLKDRHYMKNENRASIVHYQPGEMTALHCEAFGPNITNITWTRHNSDGTYTILPTDLIEDRVPYSFYSGILMATDAFDDVGVTVTCSAQNAFKVHVVEVFKLTPWKPVEVFQPLNNSSMFFWDDLTDYNETDGVIPTLRRDYSAYNETYEVIPTQSPDYSAYNETYDVIPTQSPDYSAYNETDAFIPTQSQDFGAYNETDDVIPTQSQDFGAYNETYDAIPTQSQDFGAYNETDDVIPTQSPAHGPFIQILHALRVKEENSFFFSVSYRPLANDVQVTWFNGTVGFTGVLKQESPDVKRAMFVYSIENVLFPQMEVRMTSPSTKSMAVIEFDLTDLVSVRLTEHDVNIPTLGVHTESGSDGDFIYEVGHNVTLKVRFETRQAEVDIMSDIVDVATGKYFSGGMRSHELDFNFIELVNSKVKPAVSELDVNLITSEKPLSGLLTFYLKRPMSGGLIRTLKVSKTKTLKPLSQRGVFPDRFLTFMKPEKSMSSVDGVTQVNCRVDDVCLVTCKVLGTDIGDVTLAQVKEDGTQSRVGHTVRTTSYASEVSHTFWVSPADRQNRTFECTARNGQGDVISNKTVAVPVLTLDILPQLSRVTIQESKGKSRTRYNITCTIRSSRRPMVTITCTGQSPNTDPALPSNKVMQLSRDVYRVTKIKRFDVNDNSTFLTAVTCTASTPHEATQRALHVPAVH